MRNRIFKSKAARIPELIAHIELNQKFGYGYQVRFTMDGRLLELQDSRPHSLNEAIRGATIAIKESNKHTPIVYDPKKCIKITPIEGDTVE